MIVNNIMESIGETPMLRMKNIEKKFNTKANLYCKLEAFNPAGSIKDRAALYMIAEAEKSGKLKPGGTIIEPTSGNTGIGICAIAASKGYKAIIVLPESMSIERRKIMKAYGAELVLTEASLGMQGAVDKAIELNEEIEGSIIAGQFENPANAKAHYETTAPEIARNLDGKVDVFVAGIGTGGTITGCGKYFKDNNLGTKIVAVEPAGSPLLSEGKAGKHGIQGIGANFIPKLLDQSVIDEIMPIVDDDAFETSRAIAENEGYMAGISSGAALFAGIQQALRDENAGKNIVVILPDTGERYLSTNLYLL